MKKTALPLLLSLLASLTLITACQSKPKLACNSPEVQEATIASILETAEADALTHNQAGLTIDSASIKSIFSQIKLSIDDTRTDKTDDNKISCAASLKIELPAAMLNDANALATTAKTSTLTEIAQKMGMMATGSTLKKDISFTAQQTDDGKKIKVDLFDLKSIATVPSTLAYYTLAKPAVDTKLASDAKAANDAQKAAFDKAKSANTAANKAINELWKNLPADLQAQNADAEKTWVNKKLTECAAEASKFKKPDAAAPASTPAIGIVAPATTAASPAVNYDADIARLNCDTKMTKDRFNELQTLIAQ